MNVFTLPLPRMIVCGCITWLLIGSGCVGLRNFGRRTVAEDFGPKKPCQLANDATLEEIVAHINQNVERIDGYRAGGIRLKANHMPLTADLAVQKDRRLRLVVHSIAGSEVDLGSNDEVFWFWARQSDPPHVFYCSHENMQMAKQKLGVPIEPEWLMEALGMATIDPTGMTLQRHPEERIVSLISTHRLPNGRSIKKVMTVDACHGRVLGHALYDANGQKLAQAKLGDHRIDPASGVILPHHITLDWPMAKMSLAMNLGTLQVNPASFPPQMWEMPDRGHAQVNLAEPASPGGADGESRLPMDARHGQR